MVVVGSSSPPSASFCAGTTWGTLKSTEIKKHHKIQKLNATKFQGLVFSEVAEAPQAAPTPRTLVGDLKPVTNVHFESTFSTFLKNVDFSKCRN